MSDPVKSFFDLYSKGELISAIGKILPSPFSSYEELKPSKSLLPWLVNFIDASVFSGTYEARFQNAILSHFMVMEGIIETSQQNALEMLKEEEQYLTFVLGIDSEIKIPVFFQKLFSFEKENLPLEESEIEEVVGQTPQKFQQLVLFHLRMMQGWQKIQKSKSPWMQIFSHAYGDLHPWYPLQYDLPLPSLPKTDRIPVIFCEPVKTDLTPFLLTIKSSPVIFVFTTVSTFFQMLQFPDFVDSINEPNHLTYILEFYPHDQFTFQEIEFVQSKELEPCFFYPDPLMQIYSPMFLEALKECLNQSKDQMRVDSETGNWLYEIARRMILSIQQNRLGVRRLPALHIQLSQIRWYDKHKGLPPLDKPLGPDTNQKMQDLLADLAKQRKPLQKVSKKKMVMAHIVPQIVSGGHAPTRLLENLVLHHDSEHFDLMVVSTELLREFPLEYPYNFYISQSSAERGQYTLQKFHQLKVPTLINEKDLSYYSSAYDLARLLNERQVDVVVFHGPDVINMMTTQMINAPLRILFEHGSQPLYPGFDLAIVSSFSAVDLYDKLYKKIGTHVIALPFAVDVKKGWKAASFNRKDLGLPSKGLIMTTISTKLDMRLTDQLCHAIAKILKRVPDSYYAPIGELKGLDRIKKIFAQYGVEDRLFSLGEAKGPPSQYARSMDLYLNEFPFGGCLALLDAMAAGCPVVTMYDPQGPQQARYGGDFIGVDKAITTLKVEDYIDLACRLLNDTSMRQEWSNHVKQQYEKFADEKGTVTAFENIIKKYFNDI